MIQFAARFAARYYPPVLTALFVVAVIAPALGQPAQKPSWGPISCSESGVSTEAMQRCYKRAVTYEDVGQCAIDHYFVTAVTPELRAFTVADIVRTSRSFHCTLNLNQTVSANLRTWIPQFLQSARVYGNNWSEVTKIGKAKGIYFDFQVRHCFGYVMPGRRWQMYYESIAFGYVCGAAGGGALTPDEVSRFLDTISIRQS